MWYTGCVSLAFHHHMPHPRRKGASSWFTASLNPEIKRGVLAVFLFIVAVLAALSFFGLAGLTGRFINDFFALLFGYAKYAMPALLITWAVLIERDDESEHKSSLIIGVVTLTFSLTGLLHLLLAHGQDMVNVAMQGLGGGLAGLALSFPLESALDFWVTFIILTALVLVGLLFLFNTSLSRIMAIPMALANAIKNSCLSLVRAVRGTNVEHVRVYGASEEDMQEAAGFTQKKLAAETDNEEDEETNEPDESEEDEDEDLNKHEKEKPRVAKRNPFTVTSTKGVPPVSLLTSTPGKPTAGDIKANAQIIKDMFAQFGIEVDLGEVRVGPTITQYAVKPMRGVKLSRITALANDLALELAAHPIRIEAPIPGQSYVGIEVPNQRIAMVTLKELLESEVFESRDNNLMMALGKDVAGHVWFADLPKMPHILVAGATGSGKTVCLNTIIMSLLYQNTPQMLRFIFVDPKRVELTLYDGIPHLLTPVITDVKKTINALRWAISEMERRFDLLAAAKKRDIQSYNESAPEKLPYIAFVVDELADLMTTAPKEVEAGIVRLAQMARAVGIHLILATQRPSVDVITGLIKANIPARIAFSVASLVDSRTILDMSGAEKLLGRGDMLYLSPSLSKPKRLQGAFISENELKAVVNFLKEDEPPQYDLSIVEKGAQGEGSTTVFGATADNHDPLFEEAKDLIVREGKASASFLQRRLKLGYARAARVLDELEEAKVIGPGEGAKPREILITERELDTIPSDERPADTFTESRYVPTAEETDEKNA